MSSETITEEELAEIAARCDSTTVGPWKSYVEGRDHTAGSDFIMTGTDPKQPVRIREAMADSERENSRYARRYPFSK
jgi:hypothetical protein